MAEGSVTATTTTSTQADLATKPTSSFLRLTERLSEASVKRRWEAYRDVDWEAPEHELYPEDPRWEMAAWDPLGASDWYRDQAPERRASIGLRRQAEALKVGIEFERVLSDGLLRFAAQLPNRHPAFRYVYHEITEEAQHSMMFQEFINRSSADPVGAGDRLHHRLFDRLTEMGSDLPVVFFLVVLSGEEAFDFLNRQVVRTPTSHPLLARISRIHVVEETRHVSFARAFLRDAVPRLGARQLRELRYEAAFAVNWASVPMFDVTPPLLAAMGVPAEVHQAIVESPEARKVRRGSVANVVALCDELGLVDRRLGSIWDSVTEITDEASGMPDALLGGG
jgi:hypothetical protein